MACRLLPSPLTDDGYAEFGEAKPAHLIVAADFMPVDTSPSVSGR